MNKMEKLTPAQQRIHNGLKNIGKALANFYLDGIHMAAPECTLLSKANMLAHAAREIDGGLRETFAPKALTTEKSTQITEKDKKGSGHFASILIAVGKPDTQNELANKWFAIARHFHSLAHRKRIHEGSADPAEITKLWADYEAVLNVVIGSFLGITNRLDVLLGFDNPDQNALPALKNILANPQHAHYFFTKLDKPGWLMPLQENGFFQISSSRDNSGEVSLVERWWPIHYLLAISKKVTGAAEAALQQIVDELIKNYTSGEIFLHAFIVSDLLNIIINVNHYSFNQNIRAFIEKHDAYGDTWTLVHAQLYEGFATKMIIRKDVEGLKNLLDYFLGFTTYEEPSIQLFFGQEQRPYYRNKPNVRHHDIEELLRLHGDDIVELLSMDAITIAVGKIDAIIKSGSYSLSYDNPKSIERTGQTVYGHGWEDELVYFIRDYAVKLETQQLSGLVDEWLASKTQVLQRLGIHFVRTHYNLFADKWWRYIENTGIEDGIYIHEPYVLLREHSASFNPDEFRKAVTWIERINPPYIDEEGKQDKRNAGSRIRRWLTALKSSAPESKRLLTDKEAFYRTWWGGQISDHPEFDSYGSSKIGFDYPLEPAAFAELSVANQIKFIQSYQPEHSHNTTEEGLADLLQHGAATQPEKYVYSLTDFLPLHSLYLSHLVEGLATAVRKEKLSDFSLVLDFTEAKLQDQSFKAETEKKFYYQRWLAGSIGEFVKAISFHHQRLGVEVGDVTRMIDLVLSMIDNPVFQDDNKEVRNDYINHVLNSTPGRLYGTLMELTKLWADEFAGKDAPEKWPAAVKTHFTRLVSSRADKDKDFSIVLGMNMELLRYLDSVWVEEQAESIFDNRDTEHFGYRLHATLYSGSHLSEPFYRFFKKHNLFDKALNHLQRQSPALDTVMAYALLEWKYWDGDPDGGSLLAEVLSKQEPEHIKQLLRTIYERQWLSHDELLYIWDRLMPLFEATSGLADFYPILLWLFERLDKLEGQAFTLASIVIAKSKNGREIYSFLRYLYQIVGDEVEMAGKLVLQVYEAKLISPYLEQEMKVLVKQLYVGGFKALADAICIQVTEQNSMSLKEIYNQYN